MGGGPRPAARTPPAVLGPSSGGTAAPRPLRDAIPRPDSRPSALAATEQQRLPLGAAVAAASSCSSFSGAAAYTHSRCTPMLSPSNPRMRPASAIDRRHCWRRFRSSVCDPEKYAKARFLGPRESDVKVEWEK